MAGSAMRREENARMTTQALIIRRPGERDGTTIVLHRDTELAWICVSFRVPSSLGRSKDGTGTDSGALTRTPCHVGWTLLAWLDTGRGAVVCGIQASSKGVQVVLVVRSVICRFGRSDYEGEEFHPLFRFSVP